MTIKQVKLAELAGQSSVTYKCSAKSKLFPSSPSSPYTDVIANFVGMFYFSSFASFIICLKTLLVRAYTLIIQGVQLYLNDNHDDDVFT